MHLTRARNSGPDVLYGWNGNDWTFGGDDNGTLDGGEGDDSLFGGDGADRLYGGEGDDDMWGGDGDDTMNGDAGADHFDGGLGFDWVSYENSRRGVTVSLANGGRGFGDSGGDTYRSIEGVTGTNFSDRFFGDDADNVFVGLSGMCPSSDISGLRRP